MDFWINTEGVKPSDIISDEEIERVHGGANFGPQTTPREVVNNGVLKCAFGYHQGNTARHILYHHGLIKERYGEGYTLTAKGRDYLVAAWSIGENSALIHRAEAAESELARVKASGIESMRRAEAAEKERDELAEAVHAAMERLCSHEKKQSISQLVADIAYLKRLAKEHYAERGRMREALEAIIEAGRMNGNGRVYMVDIALAAAKGVNDAP